MLVGRCGLERFELVFGIVAVLDRRSREAQAESSGKSFKLLLFRH